MPINPNIKKILLEIKNVRIKNGITPEELESNLFLGKGWISALEEGEINPPFDLMLSVIDFLNVDLKTIISKIKFDDAQSLNRLITAQQDGNNIKCLFRYGKSEAEYIIKNSSVEIFDELLSAFRRKINESKTAKTNAVIDTFFKAIELFPHINPSDIWYFIIPRIFQDAYNHPVTDINTDFGQSWKRTGGWALEKIFVEYYKIGLAKHNILIDIFQEKNKTDLLDKMRLSYKVQPNKADVLLVNTKNGKYDCFGVVHIKASFAERRSSDQSFSTALMQKQFFSPFMTMDCKATPSKHPINKGELGDVYDAAKDKRSNKRKEFEEEGYFSACFSFNLNTKPTPHSQKATARIFAMKFSSLNDEFIRMTVRERDRFYGE
ncbi:MAG TPA: BsaWI family type II restriction enzyme [Parafilimonas sp.]|nr:BsaWI family type II restriction enzyme [Parafilimonas sp.]